MKRSLLLSSSLVVTGTLLAVATTTAYAAPSLDPNFGTGGKAITTFGHDANLDEIALQTDGKIIAVGTASNGANRDWKIIRYRTDGSPDPAFGAGGTVTRDFGGNDGLAALAVQADGKIVVGGVSQPTPTSRWTVARYNTDGTPDTGFGVGGIATSFAGVGANLLSIRIQPDGRIVAAGYAFTGSGDDVAVARYNPDGSADGTFGGGGTITTGISTHFTPNDRGNAAVLQPDGKIVVFGDFDAGFHDDVFLVRYLPNGSLDSTFGGDGILIDQYEFHNGARDIALQPDGKLVVTGGANLSFAGASDTYVGRYNTDGTPDLSFGSAGKVITSYSSGDDAGLSVLVQPDGRIVVGGHEAVAGSGTDFAIRRFNADGSPDTSFGTGGSLVTPIVTGDDGIRSIRLQADGKLLAAGVASNGAYTDWALARFADEVDTTEPVVTADVTPAPNGNGWNNSDVAISWSVSDPESGIASSNGCSTTTLTTETAGTTLTCTATNRAGLSTSKSVTIQIDKTVPTISCSVTPNRLWPPNRRLKSVTATVTVADDLSGTGGFTLISVTSSEPNTGSDIKQFDLGTRDTTGLLRAVHARTYTLVYQGTDRAGNTSTCNVTVSVAHDNYP